MSDDPRFLAYQRVLASLARPFDPTKDTPVQLPGGGEATEYTATSEDPRGGYMLHPQIWWSDAGGPMFLPEEQGRNMALSYEQATEQRFPHNDSSFMLDNYAIRRSAAGGGTEGGITSLLRR